MPRAVLGPGSCQVTTRERGAPQPSVSLSLRCAVTLSPSIFARRGGARSLDITCRCGSFGLITLPAKLRLLCPRFDFVDLVVFECRDILDDER